MSSFSLPFVVGHCSISTFLVSGESNIQTYIYIYLYIFIIYVYYYIIIYIYYFIYIYILLPYSWISINLVKYWKYSKYFPYVRSSFILIWCISMDFTFNGFSTSKEENSSVKPMVLLKKLEKARSGTVFINSRNFHFLTLSITSFYCALYSKLAQKK